MTIIKITPEWNNGHCSLDNVDYHLFGWAELPAEFEGVWAEYAPFVTITANDVGEIVGMTPCEAILPEPRPEPEVDDMTKLETAIEEGLTHD